MKARTALLLLLVGQAALLLGARASGLSAISDDDYARVVIAQVFAEAPRLDPSGTSWLPLPFWLTGTFLAFTQTSLELARATAAVSGLGAALLLYASGRLLGLERKAAVGAALLLSLVPSLRPLTIATVPEYWSAALAVFGVCTLLSTGRMRLGGALALAAATACRYETWPVALGFAALCAWDAFKRPTSERRALLAAAGLSASFMAAWLVYGAFHHGSALFFVTRVAHYKAALGTDTRGLLELWTSYPLALVGREPEVTALALAAAVVALRGAQQKTPPTAPTLSPGTLATVPGSLRVLVPWALALLVLVLGDVRGGAPTHHPERALSGIWMLTTLLGFAVISRLPQRAAAVVAVLVLGVALPLRLQLEPASYGPRPEEEDMGQRLRSAISHDTRVVLATTDYGYFAIQAAAGSPGRFVIAQRHDPRDPSTLPLPQAALAAAHKHNACFIVAPLCVELEGTTVIAESSGFALSRLDDAKCASAR